MKNQITTKKDDLSFYISEINKFPILTPEEEYELAKEWYHNKDQEAAHKLVTSHLRLVVKVSLKYQNYGIPVNDLVSEANIGLMSAVKNFNPYKGARLSTYALLYIRTALQEYILRSWSIVKIGTGNLQKKLFFNIRRIKNEIKQIEGNKSEKETSKQIASNLGTDLDSIEKMETKLGMKDISLDQTLVGENKVPLLESISNEKDIMGGSLSLIGNNNSNALTKYGDTNSMIELINEAVEEALKDKERDIFKERRMSEQSKTLAQLSQKYNLSQERIRQIEESAISKIKAFILRKLSIENL